MSVFNFEPYVTVQYAGFNVKLGANMLCEHVGIAGFKHDHVAANFTCKFVWGSQPYQPAPAEDYEPIAALCFFHQVCGDNDSDMLFIAQDLKILPEVAACAG